jgi:homoserine O-acetyltransferase
MLAPPFAGELFGAGQVLDANKYYIVLPDAIGHGKSSKPSDGMRAKFPAYNYDNMVSAQHRLVTEGLGLQHMRLIQRNECLDLGCQIPRLHGRLGAHGFPAVGDG